MAFDPAGLRTEIEKAFQDAAIDVAREVYEANEDITEREELLGINVNKSENIEYPYAIEIIIKRYYRDASAEYPTGETNNYSVIFYVNDSYGISDNYKTMGVGTGVVAEKAIAVALVSMQLKSK